MGINSLGTKSVYQKWQSGKTECFAGVSREGLTCETLVKISCLHPVLTLRIPVMCRAHASLCGKFTRKLPVKTVLVFNWPWVFTLSFSHTHPLQIKTHKKYRVHKIEHNYNQIWYEIKANKIYNCKLQLYRDNAMFLVHHGIWVVLGILGFWISYVCENLCVDVILFEGIVV